MDSHDFHQDDDLLDDLMNIVQTESTSQVRKKMKQLNWIFLYSGNIYFKIVERKSEWKRKNV